MKIREMLKNKSFFIFDLDGTLVDLEDLNFNSFKTVIDKYFDINFTFDLYLKYFSGFGSSAGFINFSKEYKVDSKLEDIEKYQKEYREYKKYHLHNHFFENVKLIDGADKYLKYLKENGFKVALGTSSNSEFAKFVLLQFKLIRYFDAIVTINDVKNTKPDPEIFVKAMNSIGGNKDRSIIFEDSPNGIKCAQNTGVDYIVIHTKGKNDVVLKTEKLVINSYRELL